MSGNSVNLPWGGLLLVSQLRPHPGQKDAGEFSYKMLLDAFGKQARHAWLYRDGLEVQVLAESLQKGTSSLPTRATLSR